MMSVFSCTILSDGVRAYLDKILVLIVTLSGAIMLASHNRVTGIGGISKEKRKWTHETSDLELTIHISSPCATDPSPGKHGNRTICRTTCRQNEPFQVRSFRLSRILKPNKSLILSTWESVEG